MDKAFGPRFKLILKLMPDYMSSVIRWTFGETAGTVGMMFLVYEMKEDGKLRSSDTEIYLLVGLINLAMCILALTKAPKLFAFLSIAIDHALIKTAIVVVTYIIPVAIMAVVSVMAAMAVIEIHKGRKER